jgi:large subunit ribosomal protein L3
MSTLERNVRGLLGTKLGMTQTWDENNRIVPVTVIAAGTNVVTQVRRPETDGYNAVQIGFGEIEGRKVTKPLAGHFDRPPPRRAATSSRSAPRTPRPTRSARSSAPSCSPPATTST